SPSLRDVQILNACLTGLPGFLTGQVSTTLGADEPLECRWCPSRPVPRTTGSVRHADSVGRSAAVSVMSAVTHTNRKRETYYLHEGRTKTGKPKYHFSKKSEGEVCTAMPDGFEVYENPRGQVYCRLIKPKLFADSEVEAVREAIDRAGKKFLAQVDVKGKDIIVYEDESPVFKFTLCDKDKRLFRASRWCFRGSIDDWIELFANPQTLPHLAAKYCRHIGEESFFELM
ncbi:MAG: hypothetical protein O3A00_04175, partial [Planctomycetota bacterium]|nr:hypothetical protein [Planctomycetota bacterium]